MWGDISLWFWFSFPWWLVMLSIFSCAYWPSICFWKKCQFRASAHFFKLDCSELLFFSMLGYMSCLYILDINPLSVISFKNIFPHSSRAFLFFFICPWLLLLWKSFKFNWVPFISFRFCFHCLRGQSQKRKKNTAPICVGSITLKASC